MRSKLSTISGIFILSAIMMLAGSFELNAQEYDNTPVTISKEKVKVGGKICYSHIVLEKQTLYSISKAYEVSIEDIYKFNPSLQEVGLKKNSIIIIPSVEALKEVETVAEEETVKETTKSEEPKAIEKKEGKKKVHIRKWYEDLDMIAAQYGVTAEDIMAANNLSDNKLSNRQKLIIPTGSHKPAETEEAPESEADSIEKENTENESETAEDGNNDIQAEDAPHVSKSVRAAVLLPMRNAEGKLSRNNMDFYSGIMLAVHDLAQKGINIDISSFDIADKENPVTNEDIESSDIIIGPISAADQTRLFQSSSNTGAVISPLDPRSEKLVLEYNDLIQAPTPHRIQYQDLTNWIKEEMGEGDKVFMFSEKTARVNEAVNTMKEVMDSSKIEYTPFTYSILEGRDILEPLKEMMTPEGVNRVY